MSEDMVYRAGPEPSELWRCVIMTKDHVKVSDIIEALKLVEGDQPENKYVYDLVLRKGIIEGDVITKLNIYQRQYPKYG